MPTNPPPPNAPRRDPYAPDGPLHAVLTAAVVIALDATERPRRPFCYVPSADVARLRAALLAYGIPLDRYIQKGLPHATQDDHPQDLDEGIQPQVDAAQDDAGDPTRRDDGRATAEGAP